MYEVYTVFTTQGNKPYQTELFMTQFLNFFGILKESLKHVLHNLW